MASLPTYIFLWKSLNVVHGDHIYVFMMVFTPGIKNFLLVHLSLFFNTYFLSLNNINNLPVVSSLMGRVIFSS